MNEFDAPAGGESEKLEITASRPEREMKKKKSSKRSSGRKLESDAKLMKEDSEQKRKKKKKKKKRTSQQLSSSLFEDGGPPAASTAAMMSESSASVSANLSGSGRHYDSSGSIHYDRSPRLEQASASSTSNSNRLPPSSSSSSSPLESSQRSDDLRQRAPQQKPSPNPQPVTDDSAEELSVLSEEDDAESGVAVSSRPIAPLPQRGPPATADSSEATYGVPNSRPVSASNLISSSVANSMSSAHRGPPRHSPILSRKTLMDDLASFAEASLGTSVGDASELLSLSGSGVSTKSNCAISSTDAVTRELLVSYMLSMGAPREDAESLAFAIMSQQKTTQRAASSRDITSALRSPMTASDIDSPVGSTIGGDGSSTAAERPGFVTHKLEYIRGAASSRRAGSVRSIRDDIESQSVVSTQH
jgi:hypothetical protein